MDQLCISQAVHHLKSSWIPAFRQGALDIGDYSSGFSIVLSQSDSKAIISDIREIIRLSDIDLEKATNLFKTLAILGNEGILNFC